MTEDASRAEWLQQARSHLRGADPVLARLIDERPEFDPRAWMTQLPPMDLYGALLFQVTGQQTADRLGHLPTQPEVLDIAGKWRPYRSLATSYLFSAAFEPAETPDRTT